eukprot:9250031-Alexandrium_andersonii.AAC.1
MSAHTPTLFGRSLIQFGRNFGRNYFRTFSPFTGPSAHSQGLQPNFRALSPASGPSAQFRVRALSPFPQGLKPSLEPSAQFRAFSPLAP